MISQPLVTLGGNFAIAAMHAASGVIVILLPGGAGFGVTVGFAAYALVPDARIADAMKTTRTGFLRRGAIGVLPRAIMTKLFTRLQWSEDEPRRAYPDHNATSSVGDTEFWSTIYGDLTPPIASDCCDTAGMCKVLMATTPSALRAHPRVIMRMIARLVDSHHLARHGR